MKYLIYYPQPGKEKRVPLEFTSFEAAKSEYQRLQDVLPSREMGMVAENEYGERATIQSGRWD